MRTHSRKRAACRASRKSEVSTGTRITTVVTSTRSAAASVGRPPRAALSALLDGREEKRDAGGHREDEEEGLEDPERQHQDEGEGQEERGEEVAAPSFGHGLSSE